VYFRDHADSELCMWVYRKGVKFIGNNHADKFTGVQTFSFKY